ncbi:MAG: MFS transporter [Aggregatilineales bacterium]
MAAVSPSSTRSGGTFSALHNPNFRLYFAGQLVSTAGTWMQNIAQAALIVALVIKLGKSAEESSLWLGIVACAAGLPLVLLSPVAGVIVERVPRRRIMLGTQTAQMILAFILAALAFANMVQIWHVVVLAFLLGLTNAVDAPSRQAFVVEMVGRAELQSGIQLNSILVSASRAIGPALAAIALALFGTAWCFVINGLSFLAVIVSLLIMAVPYAIPPAKNAAPLRQMREGLRYARTDPGPILTLLLLTATAGFFSLPPIQFFAAFAATALKSVNTGYSAIIIAQGVGSVLAGGVAGWLAFQLGRGRLITLGIIAVAVVNVAMALQTAIPPATFLSFLSGLSLVTLVISLNTSIQLYVPDQLRGRVLSLYTLAFFGLSPFGALLLGFIASGIGGITGIGTANALALYGLLGGICAGVIVWRRPLVFETVTRVESELRVPVSADIGLQTQSSSDR